MAYEGMIAETISISGHNGDTISAYVARPLGAGPFPGVVLIHHNPGWDEFYREMTRKFAHHGYAAISHNLFHRAGEGRSDDVAAKVRAEGGIPDAQAIGDSEGAVQWLRAQPWLNGKVGAIGSCSGGRLAFLYACHTKSIDCVVELWGDAVIIRREAMLAACGGAIAAGASVADARDAIAPVATRAQRAGWRVVTLDARTPAMSARVDHRPAGARA